MHWIVNVLNGKSWLIYPTREKNIGVQSTIFLPTLDELFIMVFVRAIATIQLGYTDADWAGELEKRKSTTGVLFIFNGGPVSYGSKRQRATALSTRDAEFYAAC